MDNGFLGDISYVDLIILGGLFLFILFGIIRGFTNDVLSLLTWLGAFLSTSLSFPLLQPMVRTYLNNPFFADITLMFLTFVLSLIVFVVIVKGISNQVRKSVLSGLDRTLGILSGFLRGTILLTITYFMALMFWKPGATPEDFQHSRLLPLINTSGKLIHQFLIPDDLFPPRLSKHLYGKNQIVQESPSPDDLVQSLSNPKAGTELEKEKTQKTSSPETEYKIFERKALESLIDQVAPKND